MQTKQTTGLLTSANDYVTIVEQASAKISGFEQLYKEMERSINVSGKKQEHVNELRAATCSSGSVKIDMCPWAICLFVVLKISGCGTGCPVAL